MNILEKWLDDFSWKIKEAKTKKPDFLEISTILRPVILKPGLTAYDFMKKMVGKSYTLPNGAIVIIDPKLKYELEMSVNLPGWIEPLRRYNVSKTTIAKITDFEIICHKQVQEFSQIEEIFTTAAFLIHEDIEDRGVLYNLAMDNSQENINLGYYQDEYGRIKLVFLERKQPVNGQPREYHIHESDAPRSYKINRYFLTPHKG